MDDEGSTSIKRRLAAILAADIAGYSRLMEENEAATVRDLKGHQGAVLPLVGHYGGRIIDTAGDGILAEFPSVINATECAVEIQTVMATRNEGVPESRRMRFRIGINLGDVIHDETRIYGDGINVAARLEGIAEPGGICISRQVFDQVSRALKADFQALGPRTFKNIARPVDVFAIAPSDRRVTPPNPVDLEQEIRFCTAPDGVQLAYSMIGQGPPLMKTGNWMTHLEFDLESPIWRHLYRELARDHTLVRYDARGNGLSDRTVDEISFDAFVRDLETVVDAAALTRFALLGISQGCAVSIAYAVRHPERVSHLILYGGYALGWSRRARTAAQKEEDDAMLTLMRVGWGKENPAFRQLFTSQFVPGGTKEQADWFNELQRITVSADVAARMFETNSQTDVTTLLPQVSVPTLVLHAREDGRVPFEAGRRMAAGIPGARFVPLQGRNHLFLESEPAFGQFLEQTRAFLASPSPGVVRGA
jgi:class 3 adenylate cyclase/pimeloyl-ACP methyl ester carboxylesterase